MRSPLMVVALVVGCASPGSPTLKPSVVIDPTIALQVACDRGEAKSCSDLGYHLSFGNAVAHNERRAVRAFTMGCDLGSGEACARVARMFEAGRGVSVDLSAALTLHARACALGYSSSCEDQLRLTQNSELPGELARDPRCAEPCVKGGLERDEISRVMKRRQGSVAYCYELALAHNEALSAADVKTKFTIDADGGVEHCEVTNADPGLAACVVATLRTFRFPRPIGGEMVNVNFPFAFRTPASRDAGIPVSR